MTTEDQPTPAEPQAAEAAAAPTTEELVRAVAEATDRWMRVNADLANLQRRAAKDREQARRFAVRDAVRALLPCFDNLERALRSSSGEGNEAVIAGVRMVCESIPRALQECGVTPVSPEGGTFDPRFHEAIGQVPDAVNPPGTILSVQEKGYILADLVIRPARVLVAMQPPAAPDQQPEQA